MKKITFSSIFLLTILLAKSQTTTIGLTNYGNGDYPGYVLFSPSNYTKAYLIDKCGYKVNEWQSTYTTGHATYLTTDGGITRAGNVGNTTFNAGGKGGIIEKWDASGALVWSYLISSTSECQHHEALPLPNGNILALVWEKKSIPLAIAQGRNPATLGTDIWDEKIVELQPTGLNTANVVWEWHAWNHLVQDFDSTKPNFGVVADHPELFNFNYTDAGSTAANWMHLNGMDYDPIHDQILFSSRPMCEIYVIDHSTNTAQAASHSGGNSGKGGDILYRYGNPMTYNRGTIADRALFYQHCSRWIPQGHPWAGKISVFNNGSGRPAGTYSTVDVIEPPVDSSGNYTIGTGVPFGPSSLYWSYNDVVPTNLYSNNISGAFSMGNGNFMITDGQGGRFIEVDTLKNVLWEYKNPVNATGPQTQGTTITGSQVFKATFWETSFVGFNGQTLIPGAPIELNPNTYSCNMITKLSENPAQSGELLIYPVPASKHLFIEQKNVSQMNVSLYNLEGKEVLKLSNAAPVTKIDLSNMEAGIYVLRISDSEKAITRKLIIN